MTNRSPGVQSFLARALGILRRHRPSWVKANGAIGSDRTWKGWVIPHRPSARPAISGGVLLLEAEAPGIIVGADDDFVRVDSAEVTLMPCQDARYHVTKRIVSDTFDPTPWIGEGSSDPAR